MIAIGAGVPIASVLTAWMTTISVSDSHPDYMPIVAVAWGCAFMISSGALITSLVLGVLLMRSRKPAARSRWTSSRRSSRRTSRTPTTWSLAAADREGILSMRDNPAPAQTARSGSSGM